MIELSLKGQLKLTHQLAFLALSDGDKRKVHGWLAGELERAMRRAIRQRVEASPLELFEGSERVRRRKARSFAAMLGRRATAEAAYLFDKGHGHRQPRRTRRSDRATPEQKRRLRELGFRPERWGRGRLRMSVSRLIAGMHWQQASVAIRLLEEAQGLDRRSRRAMGRAGSLIMMVWRESGEVILAAVDPAAVFARFLQGQAGRRVGG